MDKHTKYTLNHKSMKQIVTVLNISTVMSITKGSLLYASSTLSQQWHVLVVGGMIVHTPLGCSAGLVGSP